MTIRASAARLRPALLALALSALAGCAAPPPRVVEAAAIPAPAPVATPALRELHAVPPVVDEVQHRTFDYFWELTNPDNGLVPDRWPTPSFSSIAAVGFGLSAYGVPVRLPLREAVPA